MWCKKRHNVLYFFLRPIFKIYFKIKYRLKLNKVKLPKEGALILCNHTMIMDPFIVALNFNKPLYFMASSDLFSHRFSGKLIKFLVNPIPKEKGNKTDLVAIRNCLKVAKENGNICIFPEGNRAFSGNLGYIDESIVKLAKLLKKPLIIANVVGGYASDPRWAYTPRKGKLEVCVAKTLSIKEIESVSNEELYKLIIDNLNVDNYQNTINYKGKKRAECLEKILYICPICNKEHSLFTKENKIICNNCNSEIIYNENLLLTSNNKDFKFSKISQWYDYQIDVISKKTYQSDELIYEDDIKVFEPVIYQKKKFIGQGKIKLYNSYLCFDLDNECLKFTFDDIYSMTLVGKMKMNIFLKDKIIQIYNNKTTNLLKYMHMFYIIKNRKEGIENGFIGI